MSDPTRAKLSLQGRLGGKAGADRIALLQAIGDTGSITAAAAGPCSASRLRSSCTVSEACLPLAWRREGWQEVCWMGQGETGEQGTISVMSICPWPSVEAGEAAGRRTRIRACHQIRQNQEVVS